MALLFLIDDDNDVLNMNKKYFEHEGYTVSIFKDAVSAINDLAHYSPDCIVLDIMMPGMNGYSALKKIQKITHAPVIFLTGKDSEDDRVEGLTSGADDYIIKPYSLRELAARIQIQIRKYSTVSTPKILKGIQFSSLNMDFIQHKVFYNLEEIPLSNREYELLYLLMANPDKEISYRQIGEHLYHIYTENDRRTIMVIVSRLRKKISACQGSENFIESIYGKGYKFVSGKKV